jgi:hypothetical protein
MCTIYDVTRVRDGYNNNSNIIYTYKYINIYIILWDIPLDEKYASVQ